MSISIFPFIVSLFNVPPILTFFAIPIPPFITTEPVVSLVLSAVPCTTKLFLTVALLSSTIVLFVCVFCIVRSVLSDAVKPNIALEPPANALG